MNIISNSVPTCASSELTLEVVSPNESAAMQVMSWRNDPETLANSFDRRPKEWPAFFTEFADTYFADPRMPPLFLLAAGSRCAFVRFRRLPELIDGMSACDISVVVAPEWRGKGISSKAIRASLATASNAGIEVVVADIKPHNEKSVRSFERAGFNFWAEIRRPVPQGDEVTVRRFIYRTHQHFDVDHRRVGPGQPCFVIAEAGSNWRMGTAARDMKMAKALIDVACDAGADAVKFQTYKAATTYVANAGESDYLSENGIKDSISDIFEDLTMPYEMVPELAEYAARQGILFMSTPFSLADFDAVDPYVALHKIASYEISHLRLIDATAHSGKPVIMSTGASELADIEWAVNRFRQNSSAGICLMQCTARYPAPVSSLNLGTLPLLRAKFGVPVGLSDHTRHPIIGPVAAVALGANVIEKHYTLDNRLPGPDHAFAITAGELKEMVLAIRHAEQAVGTGCKTIQAEEEELYAYARRGLQAVKNIVLGEQLQEGINFEILRPGKQRRGIHPRFIELVEGNSAARAIALGDGIQEGDFSAS